jgi:hypothetical protein
MFQCWTALLPQVYRGPPNRQTGSVLVETSKAGAHTPSAPKLPDTQSLFRAATPKRIRSSFLGRGDAQGQDREAPEHDPVPDPDRDGLAG